MHGHASSKFSKSPATLAKQVARAVDHPEANLLTWTEVGDPARAAELHAYGWGSFTPDGQTDCAVMWKQSHFKKIKTEVHLLTDKTWQGDNGVVHKTKCTTLVVDEKGETDGEFRRLVAMVAHLPSGVQDGKDFSDKPADADRVAAWKGAVKGWHSYLNDRIRPVYAPHMVMVIADWNVNFHLQEWRDYVQGIFTGLTLTWKNDMPKGEGTLNDRLIDATWATRNGPCVLLDYRPDTSDHRPYAEKITWE